VKPCAVLWPGWRPPESAEGDLTMAGSIRMYATSWCPDCHRAREFLRARQLPFEEIDIDAHPEAAEFVERVNSGRRKVPTFDIGGRIFPCSPYDAKKLSCELGI
jgi:mycoredoxin